MFVEAEKELTAEDIAWAADSIRHGRRVDFVASVLGVAPRKVYAAIKKHKPLKVKAPPAVKEIKSEARLAAERAFEAMTAQDEIDAAIAAAKPGRKPTQDKEDAAAAARAQRRRRFKLLQRYCRHWDMIWFLTRERMSGKSLRCIYGAETLQWARGGGIDYRI